jgi:hypothetical protein
MRSLDDLFLVWLLASMIAALLPIPRAPMMWGFGMLVWPCPTLPAAWVARQASWSPMLCSVSPERLTGGEK